MRSRDGEMDLRLPGVLLPRNQRALEQDLRDLRRFGYAFQIGRDAVSGGARAAGLTTGIRLPADTPR